MKKSRKILTMDDISARNQELVNGFWNWMETTDRARIVKFNVPGRTLRSIFDSDPLESTTLIDTMSDKIKRYQSVSPFRKQQFKITDPAQWTEDESLGGNIDIYSCYSIFKLWWLSQSIDKEEQQSPLQIIQVGRKYSCHPGSDKRIVLCLLKPQARVRCFYVHYPEFDPSPWHWTLPYDEVNTPDELVEMFHCANHHTFRFFHTNVKIDGHTFHVDDYHYKPFALGLHKAAVKYRKIKNKEKFKVDVDHLTYVDAIHRMGMMESKEMIDDIYFKNDWTFQLGEFKFLLVNDTWLPESFVKAPKSLIDSKYKTNTLTANSFTNNRPNISRHRLGQ
tara:strand:- start:13331 stop:14335 length:1005 start_codon:yes stop_codon:yes gene_type:complete